MRLMVRLHTCTHALFAANKYDNEMKIYKHFRCRYAHWQKVKNIYFAHSPVSMKWPEKQKYRAFNIYFSNKFTLYFNSVVI